MTDTPDITRTEDCNSIISLVGNLNADGKEPGMRLFLGDLMTSVLIGGKDTQAEVCPVLVARMRSSDGRRIVDSVRGLMQSWDDNEVGSI